MPWIVLESMRLVDGQKGITGVLIAFLVGSLLHSVIPVLLGVSIVMALLLSRVRDEIKMRMLSRALMGLTVVAIVVAYAMRHLGSATFQRHLLAWFNSTSERQAIFSSDHALNISNWLVLSAAAALVMIPLLFRKGSDRDDQTGRYRTFALWLIIPSLCFLFFFKPELGGPRDWDLFSLACLLLVIAMMIALRGRGYRKLPSEMIAAIVIGLVSVGGFVRINHLPVESANRFVEVMEVSRFKSLLNEYTLLLSHAQLYPELSDRRLEFAEKCYTEGQHTRQDSLEAAAKVSQLSFQQGDLAKARRYFGISLSVDSADIQALQGLGMYFMRTQAQDSMLWVARAMHERLPRSAEAQLNAAILLVNLGDTANAELLYQQAYQLDGSNVDILRGYGSFLLRRHRSAKAVQLLEKASSLQPSDILTLCFLGRAYLEVNAPDEAAVIASRAESLAKDPQDVRMVRELQGMFKRP